MTRRSPQADEGDDDDDDREKGPRKAVSELAAIVAEVRKINPTAEETLSKYVRLIGEMGDAYIKMFSEMNKALMQSYGDQRFLVQTMLELLVVNGTINTDVVRAQQEGETRRAGIRAAERVGAGVVEKIDAELINSFLRKVGEYYQPKGEGT